MISVSLLDFGTSNEPQIPCIAIIDHLTKNISNYEKMGYKRFWLTEHYDSFSSWSSPEIIISLLASKSKKIRIGAAGILLKYNNAFRIAQNFSMLNTIFEGRIDLGIAKGNVTPDYTLALNNTNDIPNDEYFIQQTEDLFKFLYNDHEAMSPFEKIKVKPTYIKPLNTWFLGSSESSLPLAVKNQSNFCISLFHSMLPYNKTMHIPELFRELFYKQYGYIPEVSIAIKCYTSKCKKNIEAFQHIIDNSPWFNKNHAMIGTVEEISDKVMRVCDLYKVDDIVIVNEFINLEEKLETAADFATYLIRK